MAHEFIYNICFSLYASKKTICCKYLTLPNRFANKHGEYDIRECACLKGFNLVARNIGYPKKSEPDYPDKMYYVSVIYKNFACYYQGQEIRRKIEIYTGPTRGCARGCQGFGRKISTSLYPRAGFSDSREY